MTERIERKNGTLEIEKNGQHWTIQTNIDNGNINLELINSVVGDDKVKELIAILYDTFGGCGGVIVRDMKDEANGPGDGGSSRQDV